MMKSRNAPRGGNRNDVRDLLDIYADECADTSDENTKDQSLIAEVEHLDQAYGDDD